MPFRYITVRRIKAAAEATLIGLYDDDLRTGRLLVKRATVALRRVVDSATVSSSFDVCELDEFIARHPAIHEQSPDSRTGQPRDKRRRRSGTQA